MTAKKIWLDSLNANQKLAVQHGQGPLLILAGAGSGKTSVMTYRIAHLILEKNIPPSSILGLSFTNKAAGELKDRVSKLLKKQSKLNAKGMIVSTFHSLCVRILKQYADKIGYQSTFSIIDASDQEDILRQILKNIHIDDRRFEPRFILSQISLLKNKLILPDQAEGFFAQTGVNKIPSDYEIAILSAYPHYQDKLRLLNAMDFDDLLLNTSRLFHEHPEIQSQLSDRFKYILVDEYQDTNSVQFKILQSLTLNHENLCVVGDDDQSIYAWRGADPSHILNFKKYYPNAKVITLDQNYRSTNTILEAANSVISKNRVRHHKTLWSNRGEGEIIKEVIAESDREEADWVGDEILRLSKTNREGQDQTTRLWKDFAVLFRSNPQSRLFEEALRMRKIPYELVGTLSYLDRKEIKDVLSYWKLVINPHDDLAARRIINWPARSIGRTALEKIHQHATENKTSFLHSSSELKELPPKTLAGIRGFHDTIHQLRSLLHTSEPTPAGAAEWARRSLQIIGVREELERDEEDPVKALAKWENVDELANAIGQVPVDELQQNSTEPINAFLIVREYLARLLLAAKEDDKEEDKDPNKARLMTLHSAKGLEYPVVFLVGMEDGLLPHKRVIEEGTSLEEERRLCYVGITRARDLLILTRTRHRIRYGKKVPRTPSRFLEEIPKHLVVTYDESASPDFGSQENKDKHEKRIRSFLDQIRSQIEG